MVKGLEPELNGTLKENSNTDNLVVAKNENVYEVITAEAKVSNDMENDLKDEHKTKSDEDKMTIYIENINTV